MKILLIKRGAIGDLLMATPLIRQIKQKLNCQLDIVVGKTAAIAIRNNKHINNQIILDDIYFTTKGIFKLSKELLKLRNSYDYVFVLDKHWYFNLLAKIIGGFTIGYVRDRFSKVLLDKSVIYNDVTRYHGYYYLDLLDVSNLVRADYADVKLDLAISASDEERAEEYIELQAIDNYVVVVNSGGNSAYEKNGLRMLPKSKILALISKLLHTEQVIVLSGGNLDFAHYEEYRKLLDYHPRLINAAGKLSLAASGVLFKHANHVYTTDCGAMHIAVAMHISDKLTTFFGPTNPRHILPSEYLINAIWSDQEIYDAEYQISGTKRKAEPEYFTKIDIDRVIANLT